LALAAALLVVGCSSAEDDDAQRPETFAEHMHGHLVHVDAIKAGVIAGDIDATREHSIWLSEHDEPPGMPDPWEPYVKEMRQYAAVAAAARDLEPVAVAVSEIARTCGECHASNGAGPRFDAALPPPDQANGIATQMHRHLWAADRLWESLLGPSEASWTRGADMLAGVRLSADQFGADPADSGEIESLLRQARAIGTEGAATGAGPARSVLLGRLLSLCAGCHALTGGGPAPR
jgi:cytochrome c553